MKAAGVAWEWRAGGDLKTVSKPMAALVFRHRTGKETFFNAIVAASTGWSDKCVAMPLLMYIGVCMYVYIVYLFIYIYTCIYTYIYI